MSAERSELVPLTALVRRSGHAIRSGPGVTYLMQLKPSGRRTMRASLDKVAKMLGGGDFRSCPWDLLTYEHVVAVRAVLEQTYAAAYVNRHLTAIRSVARECWRIGTMDGDTLARIRDVPNVQASTLPAGRMLQLHELHKLWANADELDAAILGVLFSGGLRRQEASSLRKEDVELLGAMRVRLHVWGGKGGKDRTVTVAGGAGFYLQTWLEKAKGPSFLGLSASGIYERLRRLILRVGLQSASPHDLRRSFISHALDAGADLATVSRLAGHSDPRSTARYDRRGERAEESAADRLADFTKQDKSD